MARLIDIKPQAPAELAPPGTKKALVEAFNTGLEVLNDPRLLKESYIFPDARIRALLTRRSLTDIGLDPRGLKEGQLPEGRVGHIFSRTGEPIEFEMGVFTGGVIKALETQAGIERRKKTALEYKASEGFPTSAETINDHAALESTSKVQAELLQDYSTPLTDLYDLTSEHPDIQAIVEYYAWMAHTNTALESAMAPSQAHNEADWEGIIKQLRQESVLRLPIEASMARDETGSNRWKKLGCAAIPLLLGGGLLGLVLCNSGQAGQGEVPSVVATAAAKGQPPIGIIPVRESYPTAVIAPSPEVSNIQPSAEPSDERVAPGTEIVPDPAEECEPGMEFVEIVLVRQGDSDANRIYRYPNRVNPAGDSAKGLFEKELASLYAKDNPYSDVAIRYNLRNQSNEGRNVAPNDTDLALLLEEARLFYTEPVADAAYLAFISSIIRNNPAGTLINSDQINSNEFRSQAPETFIRQLQAIRKP